MKRQIYVTQNEATTQFSKSLLKSGLIFAEIFLFPTAARSFFKYYVTGSAKDSFQSIFPSMYISETVLIKKQPLFK